MIYAADAAHDIHPLRICMISYPFLHTPQAYIIRVSGYHSKSYFTRSDKERISLKKDLQKQVLFHV